MRNTRIDPSIITGVSVTQNPLGWVVAWKSNDGNCVGRTTPQPTITKAHQEAHGMVEGTGYQLAI